MVYYSLQVYMIYYYFYFLIQPNFFKIKNLSLQTGKKESLSCQKNKSLITTRTITLFNRPLIQIHGYHHY
jgi:hypothetical protein